MSTYEDRIVSLERKVAALELRRLYDEGLARENTPAEQGHNLREINENMTMLLGVVGSQERDIKTIQEDVSSIKDRLDRLETKSDQHTRRFDRVDTLLTQILARLPEKP